MDVGAVGRGALQSQRPQGLGWALPLTAAAVPPLEAAMLASPGATVLLLGRGQQMTAQWPLILPVLGRLLRPRLGRAAALHSVS